MSILVVAEHDNSTLKGSTNSTIAAAKEIGSDISVLVVGNKYYLELKRQKNLEGRCLLGEIVSILLKI